MHGDYHTCSVMQPATEFVSSHSLQKPLQELIMKELVIVMLIAGLIPALDCYPAVRWDPTASD